MTADDNAPTDSSVTGATGAVCGHPFENPPLRGHHALRAHAALTGDAHQVDDPVTSEAALKNLAWLLTDINAWAEERDVDFERALVLAMWHCPDYASPDQRVPTDGPCP